MSIVVATPTGHIGGRVVERLLERGEDVAVIARDPGRLPAAVRERATVHQGSLDDADFLRRATAGAEALFFLVPPPAPDVADWAASQLGIGRAGAEAVRANGVGRVVFLSSVGAHRDDLFAISRLGEIERMLAEAAPNVVSLRAGFFMENFLAAVPTIAQAGAVFQPLSPEQRAPLVATRDIGDVAARWLADRAWSGHHVRGVHGAADVSFAEAAETFGRVLNRPVAYVQVPPEAMRDALLAAGMGPVMAEEYPKMFARLRDVGFESAEPRDAETTTPTTLEQWAREVLKPAVEAFEAAAAVPA